MRYQRGLWLGIIVTAALMAVACSGKMFTSEGKFVAEDKRIELSEGGSYRGSWETMHLTVNYDYLRNEDKLQISGEVLFKREETLASFHCNLVFISSQGTILQITRVTSAPVRQDVSKLSFNRELELPKGTRSMAFSYSGAEGGGKGSGSRNLFWSVPW